MSCLRRTGIIKVVFKDPTDARGVGSEFRSHPLRQPEGKRAQALQDPGPGKVDIHVIAENDREHGKAHRRLSPHLTNAGQSLQRRGKWIGDLILHLPSRSTRPVRQHNDLIFTQIGDRINRRLVNGLYPREGDDQCQDQDQSPVLKAPSD